MYHFTPKHSSLRGISSLLRTLPAGSELAQDHKLQLFPRFPTSVGFLPVPLNITRYMGEALTSSRKEERKLGANGSCPEISILI